MVGEPLKSNALARVKLDCGRCSHGPVGRLVTVRRRANMNRPQAGGYKICEIALADHSTDSACAQRKALAWGRLCASQMLLRRG